MIVSGPLPPELQNEISGEKIDFVVKSSRLKSPGEALHFLSFSALWLGITLTVGAGFFLPLLYEGSVNIEINDVPTTVTHENLEVMIFPAVFIGIFIVIGLAVLSYGIYATFASGGWYIGMPEGLSHYRKGKTEFIKWDKFTTGVEIKGDEHKGKLILNLQGRGAIHIFGAPEPQKIADICKQRIRGKEPASE